MHSRPFLNKDHKFHQGLASRRFMSLGSLSAKVNKSANQYRGRANIHAANLEWGGGCCRVRKGAGSQSFVSCVPTISLVESNSKQFIGASVKLLRACMFTKGTSTLALVYYRCLSVCFGAGQRYSDRQCELQQ